VSLGTFALDMLTKDRLALRPEKIKDIDQLKSILNEAKRLEAA
jgi:hypothetical protein